MEIIGIEGLSREQIGEAVQRGAKFVLYQYCWSALLVTSRRNTDVHYIAPGASRVLPGLKFSLFTLVVGWWGIPWGPIYTVASLITNFGGGRDVTSEMLYILAAEGEVPGKER